MCEPYSPRNDVKNIYISPQCQYFVTRKKRLCRMTVKPGKQYCGEHEPQPKIDDGKNDTRVPCPNDPKHTCYISKMEKHLSICNARQQKQPDYIVNNMNSPTNVVNCVRLPLSQIPLKMILKVIEKVNLLYERHLKGNITMLPERPIHEAILDEFNQMGRTENSLRHLRQASSILHVVENHGLTKENTCYVELGAGKGHLSYYAFLAWCQGTKSRVLLIDRASLRHKRDNKLKDSQNIDVNQSDDAVDKCLCNLGETMCTGHCASKETRMEGSVHRIRADLAHLALDRVPAVRGCDALVGYAKHLCGVATDYALRCITADEVLDRVQGVVLATCCHHRCDTAAYPANSHLENLGISSEDFNVILGIVSWATCGDGRSRERRNRDQTIEDDSNKKATVNNETTCSPTKRTVTPITPQSENPTAQTPNTHKIDSPTEVEYKNPETSHLNDGQDVNDLNSDVGTRNLNIGQEQRQRIGRRAKALLDWGRVLFLIDHGFDARLVYYVPTAVSLENVCIIAKKIN